MAKPVEILGMAMGHIDSGNPSFFLREGKEIVERFPIDVLNPDVRANPDNAKWLKSIESKIDPSVLERIRRGRVRISLVINSFGGEAFTADRLSRVCDNLKARGGRVLTYGIDVVQSAGALLWMLGDERYCLKETRLLWHTRVLERGKEEALADHHRAQFEASVNDDRATISGIVDAIPGSAHRHYFERQISGDPRATLRMSGAVAHAIGLADRAFGSLEELKAHHLQS